VQGKTSSIAYFGKESQEMRAGASEWDGEEEGRHIGTCNDH